MRIALFFPATLLSVFFAVFAEAQPFKIGSDFDGDDVSDITYTTTSADSLLWKSVPSLTNGTALNESFGKVADVPLLAHWEDKDAPVISIVRKPSRNGALSWKILREGGFTDAVSFGATGDVVLGGGDFDGNGTDDAAVVRPKGKRLVWRIRHNMFADPISNYRKQFGVLGDRAFYASPDGERDWLGTFGKSGKKRTKLALFNIETKEIVSTKKIPRRLTRLPRPRPMPLKQADGTDLILFVEPKEEDTKISVFSLDGELVREKSFTGTGVVTIGDYLADEEGEEMALHLSTKIRFYNPVTEGAGEASTITGVPIGEYSVVLVASVPTATPTPTPTATETPDPNE